MSELGWGGGGGLLVRLAEAGCENHKTRLRPCISRELVGGSHGGMASALHRDPSGGVRGVRLLQSFQQEEAEASAGPRGMLGPSWAGGLSPPQPPPRPLPTWPCRSPSLPPLLSSALTPWGAICVHDGR